MEMMNPTYLGKLANEHQQRDAIHVAIAPVVAACTLKPGQRIAFVDEARTKVGPSDSPVGIVDPFLTWDVAQTQRCWMLLFPNTVTSLRHDWTHPAFSENPVKAMSEIWIRNWANECDGLSYEEVMEAANDYVEHGDYFKQGGRFEGMWVPDEFWEHYEVVTGKKVDDRGSFFSCSC